jgi:hypothetical protein
MHQNFEPASEADSPRVSEALRRVLHKLPDMVDAQLGAPVSGAAVCVLTSDGESHIAIMEGQALVPAALMVAATLVKALQVSDTDIRTQALLAKSFAMLDYAIHLKRGDVHHREGLH